MTNVTDPAMGVPADGSTRRLQQDLSTLPAEQTPVEANVTANATEGTTEGGVRRMQDPVVPGEAPVDPAVNETAINTTVEGAPGQGGVRRMQLPEPAQEAAAEPAAEGVEGDVPAGEEAANVTAVGPVPVVEPINATELEETAPEIADEVSEAINPAEAEEAAEGGERVRRLRRRVQSYSDTSIPAAEQQVPEVAQNITNTTGATRRLQETGAAGVPVGAPEAVEAANMTNVTDPAMGVPADGSTRRLQQDLSTLPAEQTPVEANVTANATEGTTEGGVRRMQDLGGAAPPPPEANVTTNMSDAAVQPPDAGTRRMQTVGGADAAQQQAGYVAAEEQAMANVTNATDPVSQGGTRRMQDNMGGVMEMPVNETNTTTEGQMGQGQGGIRRRRLQTFDGAEGPDAAGTEMRDDSLGYDAAQTEDQAESVSGGVPQQGTEVGAGAAGAGAGEEDFPTAEEITPAPEEVLAEPEQQVPGFLEGELVGGPDSEARTGGE